VAAFYSPGGSLSVNTGHSSTTFLRKFDSAENPEFEEVLSGWRVIQAGSV
jgi:hypothetical protein